MKVSAPVREPNDRAGVADIQPLRIGTGRIESDPERLIEAVGKDLIRNRATGFRPATKNPDSARIAFGDQEIPVWSGDDLAGIVEATGVQLDLKTLGRLGPSPIGPADEAGAIVDAPSLVRRRQIRHRDLSANTRGVGRPIAKRCPARKRPSLGSLRDQGRKGRDGDTENDGGHGDMFTIHESFWVWRARFSFVPPASPELFPE